jgi:hypothetical protein
MLTSLTPPTAPGCFTLRDPPQTFHRGDIAVYQTLLSRPERSASGLPLTREDWYAPGV